MNTGKNDPCYLLLTELEFAHCCRHGHWEIVNMLNDTTKLRQQPNSINVKNNIIVYVQDTIAARNTSWYRIKSKQNRLIVKTFLGKQGDHLFIKCSLMVRTWSGKKTNNQLRIFTPYGKFSFLHPNNKNHSNTTFFGVLSKYKCIHT